MGKYLADMKKGSLVSATALIKMDKKGKISIKVVGYDDVISAVPVKPQFNKIEDIEILKEPEEEKIESEVKSDENRNNTT